MLFTIDTMDQLKVLKEAQKTGEEVEIQCPDGVICEECPFSKYCSEGGEQDE